MSGKAEFPAEWRKIADELPGVPLPPAARAPNPKSAVDFFVERLRNSASPVVILALGPLTNIAEALERNKSIAPKIREIVLMGGAVRVPGNLQDGGLFRGKNNTAEWNIFIDPVAASIVFRSGIPVRLIALDATNTVKIGPEFVRDYKAKPLSPLGHIVAGVLEADREAVNQGIFYAWDPLAAAALLRPDIVTTAPMHIDVKLDGVEAGRTVATPGKPNTKVAIQADAGRFLALFRESFSETGVR
jgi:pyrimidine-specific ribonucleoside hydrolase